jgi:hypothetical protein
MSRIKISLISGTLFALGLALALAYPSRKAEACLEKDYGACECPQNDSGSVVECTIKKKCEHGCYGWPWDLTCEWRCSQCDITGHGGEDCPKSGGDGDEGGSCGTGGCYRDLMCVPCGY